MDYSNWMSSTTAIHGLPLGNICLPASHDSGTFGLTTQLTQDLDSDEQEMVGFLQQIAVEIQDIPGVTPYIPNPYNWVYDAVILTVRDLMTATSRSVAQQLADGIRCLDLRIYFDATSGCFYTYHTLVGTELSGILDEIATFLASTKAEIVYVTFGHFRGFQAGDATFSELTALVTQKLGAYAYPQLVDSMGSQIVNPVFQQTYEEIVSYGTTGSKVVLANAGYSSPSLDSTFWPKPYSPPDDEGQGGVVAGDYANSSSLGAMIDDQKTEYKDRGALPFALYMTLTPQDTDVIAILSSVLALALNQEAARVSSSPTVAVALEAIAAQLQTSPPSWTSLQQLSLDVDTDLGGNIDQVVGTLPSPNPLSLLYLDFYEVTNVVDLAIQYSTGQDG